MTKLLITWFLISAFSIVYKFRAMGKWVHQERDQAQVEVRTLTKQVDAKSKMKSY